MVASWSLAPLVTRHAAVRPEHVLAMDGERTWTYREVEASASALAVALVDLGIGAGDRIAVHLPSRVEWMITTLATAKLGAVLVPLHPELHVHDLRYQLRHAEASLVVTVEHWKGVDLLDRFETLFGDLPELQYVVTIGETDPWYDDRVHAFDQLVAQGSGRSLPAQDGASERAADDQDLAILYTSGTMGKPKGVQLSHRALVENAVRIAETLGLTAADRVMSALPFSSIFGFSAMLGTMVSGATLVLAPAFDPAETLARLVDARVTVWHAVPTQYHLLMRVEGFDPSRLAALRTGLMAGTSVTEPLMRQVRRWCDVLVAYGLTETGAVVTMTRTTDSVATRHDSVGTALPGVEVMALDVITGVLHGPEAVGEIAVRGSSLMRGYLRMPAESAKVRTPDGFFLTGDLGIIDEDGVVRILGRRQETIARGGLPLYPREIEDRLRAHPAVDDVCVIGVPHDLMGELVCACVVAVEGAVITGDELKRFALQTMSAEKVPDLVRFFDTFPMTGSGKVRRRELARAIALSANALSHTALAPTALDHPVA